MNLSDFKGVLEKMVKKLTANEFNNVKELVKRVFDKCVAQSYTEEGVEEFFKFVYDNDKLATLDRWGYYIEDRLIGVIGTRDEMLHSLPRLLQSASHIAPALQSSDGHLMASRSLCAHTLISENRMKCWVRKLRP